MKYGISHRFTGEIRGAIGKGINIISARGYYNFFSRKNILAFLGADLGYIIFDTNEVEGTGTLIMPFIGGEYFIGRRLSIGADIGPAFITLRAREHRKHFTVSGIEWIFNLGFNYYFGRQD